MSAAFPDRAPMPRDSRHDAYIAKAAPFARPILRHLRDLVHAACPDVTETVKWGMPHFEHHGILCMMAAFKAHCVFGFWQSKRIVDPGDAKALAAMGQFGRIRSLDDLPSDRAIKAWVRKAVAVNESGRIAAAPRKHPRRPAPRTPADLSAALKANAKAKAHWEAFAPSHRREYVEWIVDAKRPETRAKRLATTVEWVAKGKGRNWKYERAR